jgi:hypothetical protein
MRFIPISALLASTVAVPFLAAGAEAQTPLAAVRVTSGLNRPLWVGQPPGDFERLFIAEQGGKIRIFKGGALLATPFLDVGPGGLGKASSGSGERGLLGVAFHPDYENNGQFYVNYTRPNSDTVIEQYTVSGNPDLADPGSGVTIFGPYFQPQSNHNGGCIAFSPIDGKLYCGMGDGGGANDQGSGHVNGIGNAQSGTTLLGKMIRLDVDIPFPHVPDDNPFLQDPNTLDLTWSYGQRNPWRFSFDRTTGDMYIGDVGQNAKEEISFEPVGMGGLNYGWRCMEGFDCTGLSGCSCNAPELTLPIYDYTTIGGGNRCTVVGGYVYRGCAAPDLDGTYFYADYCKFKIWTFEWDGVSVSNWTNRTGELTPAVGTITSISSFGEDNYGELYVCDLGGGAGAGEVYKIVPATMTDCNANSIEDSCDIALGTSEDCNLNGVPDECETVASSYCTAGTSASGCNATLSSTGTPSLSLASGFTVDAATVEGSKDGLFFYGFNGPQANSWGSGTSFQCVVPPVTRTPIMSGVGTGGVCDGSFSLDLNTYWSTAPANKVPAPGGQVNLQLWHRDPQNTSNQTTSLSDALEFSVCP